MTKEELIPIIERFYQNNSIDPNDLNKLLISFMIDIDEEKYNKIKSYIPLILNSPQFMMRAGSYIGIALDYYEKKLHVTKVYDKDNRLITIF